MTKPILKVAVGGFGAIGKAVASALDRGIDGLQLVAVSAQDITKARAHMAEHFLNCYDVCPLDALSLTADVVVECCPAHLLDRVARPALEAGKIVVVISVGGLLANPHLTDIAARTGGRILVPSGALLGLDAVQAAAQGRIDSVTIVTRKPPVSLKGAPAITRMGLDLDHLTEPVRCFAGSAQEAIKGFPANANVAVALGLAGIGTDRTQVEVWADPNVDRNTHSITVVSDSANMTLKIEGIPSDDNPRTGRITPLSVISTLKRLTAPLVIGA
ncbi:aspartate dehydrogenase [Antarctobacter sp.]|uniref:aspartate dehydrogenase n=1 Tax=Antarctobacter sp. TaxID=1872577 RepID=UPI003A913C6A